MADNSFGYGQMDPEDGASEFSVIAFVCRQIMARMETMRLVKVVAVHTDGGAAAAGTVDVQPLVSQIDGNGNPVKHGIVNGIRYFRLQGGTAAVIIDPKVDDVGYVICASRDSSLCTDGSIVNPGSYRTFDLADGVYIGGILNAVPQTYVLFKDDGGIKMVDGFGNVLESSSTGFALTGNLAVTGTITATGNITAGFGGAFASLLAHIHAANNTPPTPGH